jgi:hypothetical protein
VNGQNKKATRWVALDLKFCLAAVAQVGREAPACELLMKAFVVFLAKG